MTAKINGTAGLEDEVGWVQRFDFPNLWRDINQNPEKVSKRSSYELLFEREKKIYIDFLFLY